MKRRETIILFIFGLVPIALVLALWHRLPQQVPIHWNLHGAVDSWGSRPMLLLLAGIGLLLALLAMVLPRLDPKKANYVRFSGTYFSVLLLIELFLLFITVVTVIEALQPGTVNIRTAVVFALGLLFAFFGNLLPKVKPNYFFGIRTAWTLNSETVWYHTHRLSGFVWFLGGLCIAASAWLPETVCLIALIGLVLLLCVVPIAASYVYFRQENTQ